MNVQSFISLVFFILFFNPNLVNAQIGIGTTTPDASSILDLTSTTQGLLIPRMTTALRTSIALPTQGLVVYDTNASLFYFYNGSSWAALESESTVDVRNNYKLVKSAADLANELSAGGGSVYLLDTNTLYEINGLVEITVPIDLNGAHLRGRDSTEDRIFSNDYIFTGSSGGTIEGVSIYSISRVFTLTGTGTESITVMDCSLESDIGFISNYASVYFYNNQLENLHLRGIRYTDIDELYVYNSIWDVSNSGSITAETYTGNFGTITKQGGTIFLDPSNTSLKGINISGIISVNSASLTNVTFAGGGNYITGSSPYTGYNFSKDWEVRCSGIPIETDENATGECYYNNALGVPLNYDDTTTFYRISEPSIASHLFRFSQATMSLTYEGKTTRTFNIVANLSVATPSSSTPETYTFYIGKNFSALQDTIVYHTSGSSDTYTNIVIEGTIELAENDTVQIYTKRETGTGNTILSTTNLRLTAY